MRTEKFDNSKSGYDSDDIKYAFNYNGLSEKLDEIDVIVAEVCGENDGADWFWILQMKDGSFANAQGGCDYTGWDCQSSADFEGGFKTPEEAINAIEKTDKRLIKETLLKQINGDLPFAVYSE